MILVSGHISQPISLDEALAFTSQQLDILPKSISEVVPFIQKLKDGFKAATTQFTFTERINCFRRLKNLYKTCFVYLVDPANNTGKINRAVIKAVLQQLPFAYEQKSTNTLVCWPQEGVDYGLEIAADTLVTIKCGSAAHWYDQPTPCYQPKQVTGMSYVIGPIKYQY